MLLKDVAEQLQKGQTVRFRPTGYSMSPTINSGDIVTVAPAEEFSVGDVVLCKVAGDYKLHLIKDIKQVSGKTRYLISNAKGKENGWTLTVYGKRVSNSFDKQTLATARASFIKEFWDNDSKITNVISRDEGLEVHFLHAQGMEKFLPRSHAGVPLFKSVTPMPKIRDTARISQW
jgi:hypothetical protein